PTIWNADFTTERANSNYGNPYLFTGRRVDILDSGSLKIQYNRNRYYDYYSGRWLTQDPLGITPNPQWPNRFGIIGQYGDAINLYQYVASNPSGASDPWGLQAPISIGIGLPPASPPGPLPLTPPDCPHDGCPTGWLDPLPSTGRMGDWHVEDAFAFFISGNPLIGLIRLLRPDKVEFSHESTFAHRLAERKGFHEWSRPNHGLKDILISKGEYYAHNLGPCDCTCFGYSHSGVGLGWVINEDDGIDDWVGLINRCDGPEDAYCDLEYTVRCCVKKACVDGKFVGELACRVRFDMKDTYSFDVTSWRPARLLGRPFEHIIHFDKTLDDTIPLPE
ncbi:MAG: RHS repeat-associated core domain-containing protein, partial [Sedimentisphaerales bacterium]